VAPCACAMDVRVFARACRFVGFGCYSSAGEQRIGGHALLFGQGISPHADSIPYIYIVCVYIYMCICVCVCVHYTDARALIAYPIYIVCVYTYMCVCVCVCVCVSTSHRRPGTHILPHIYSVCIYTCVCVCVCVCVYTTQTSRRSYLTPYI
jgi:hypothetical protein